MVKSIECTRCGLCVRECEFRGAIQMTDTGVSIDLDKCIACGHCAAVCPTDAMDNPKAPAGPSAGELPAPGDMARYLRQARSVRCFKEGGIPRKKMTALLNIGRYPQTAVNTQGVSYLVLENREKVKALGELYCRTVLDSGIKDPLRPFLADIANEQLTTGRDIIFRTAPHVILALVDENNPRGRDSARYALTFISLLAPSMGAGTCWAGFFEALALDPKYAPVFLDFLNAPEGKTIGGVLMAGVPDITYRRLAERDPLQVEWR